MKLGIVIGKIWASKKVRELEGCRLSLVQPVTSEEKAIGSPLVVADPEGIGGSGDLVVYVTGTDATEAFHAGYVPVNASIVELVDEVN